MSCWALATITFNYPESDTMKQRPDYARSVAAAKKKFLEEEHEIRFLGEPSNRVLGSKMTAAQLLRRMESADQHNPHPYLLEALIDIYTDGLNQNRPGFHAALRKKRTSWCVPGIESTGSDIHRWELLKMHAIVMRNPKINRYEKSLKEKA